MPENTPGPHHITCLNQWWEDTGCLQEGLHSPRNDINLKYWNSITLGQVKSDMRNYRKSADENVSVFKLKCFGRNTPGNMTINHLVNFPEHAIYSMHKSYSNDATQQIATDNPKQKLVIYIFTERKPQ